MDIKINTKNDFGNRFLTESLLNVAAGIHKVSDAKEVCKSYSDKFVGHVGFYKKATQIIGILRQKDSKLAQVTDELNSLAISERSNYIQNYIAENGEYFDIII